MKLEMPYGTETVNTLDDLMRVQSSCCGECDMRMGDYCTDERKELCNRILDSAYGLLIEQT